MQAILLHASLMIHTANDTWLKAAYSTYLPLEFVTRVLTQFYTETTNSNSAYVYTLKSRPSLSGFQRGISQASPKNPRSSVLQMRSAVQGQPM